MSNASLFGIYFEYEALHVPAPFHVLSVHGPRLGGLTESTDRAVLDETRCPQPRWHLLLSDISDRHVRSL